MNFCSSSLKAKHLVKLTTLSNFYYPGATHMNCYAFISMVTGCSTHTISRVFSHMVSTGGLREPPEHGMKKYWENHYKATRTNTGREGMLITNYQVKSVKFNFIFYI